MYCEICDLVLRSGGRHHVGDEEILLGFCSVCLFKNVEEYGRSFNA